MAYQRYDQGYGGNTIQLNQQNAPAPRTESYLGGSNNFDESAVPNMPSIMGGGSGPFIPEMDRSDPVPDTRPDSERMLEFGMPRPMPAPTATMGGQPSPMPNPVGPPPMPEYMTNPNGSTSGQLMPRQFASGIQSPTAIMQDAMVMPDGSTQGRNANNQFGPPQQAQFAQPPGWMNPAIRVAGGSNDNYWSDGTTTPYQQGQGNQQPQQLGRMRGAGQQMAQPPGNAYGKGGQQGQQMQQMVGSYLNNQRFNQMSPQQQQPYYQNGGAPQQGKGGYQQPNNMRSGMGTGYSPPPQSYNQPPQYGGSQGKGGQPSQNAATAQPAAPTGGNTMNSMAGTGTNGLSQPTQNGYGAKGGQSQQPSQGKGGT